MILEFGILEFELNEGTWTVSPARRAPEGASDWNAPRALRRAYKKKVALVANSNTNGTEIDHKWDQSGPGGGKGYPKINENMKK